MKRIVFAFLLFGMGFFVSAQKPVVSKAVGFKVSQPVKSMPAAKQVEFQPVVKAKNKQNEKAIRKINPYAPYGTDGALSDKHKAMYHTVVPEALNAPSVSFDGVISSESGCSCYPPDVNGEAGLTQFVQTVNTTFRVWDKLGNPLTPVLSYSSLFAPLATACSQRNDGDPVVMYDQLADRWLITQFCLGSFPHHQMIAVSKTGDATGEYYLYEFEMPANKFNDYPHFGVWPDAYYMTNNQFNTAGNTFLGGGNFAFDRKKMIAGDPTASYIYFDGYPISPNFGGALPADVDGFTPPPAGAPCPFIYFTANEFGDPADGLRIFDFHADFAVPANSSFTERAGSPLLVAPFNPLSANHVAQPGTAVRLDALSDRLMFRISYRNFGGVESMILNHTVNVGTNFSFRGGVRFYKLDRAGVNAPFTIAEQETYTGPVGNLESRWMGSGAINHQGDVAVGFSTSSSTMFPSIHYAARLGTDPPGSGLIQGEQLIHTGTGSQTGSAGRWGDYSNMTVDPVDDCTFWYTQEYLTATGSIPWRTRIAKFTAGTCSPSPRGTVTVVVRDCSSNLPITGAMVELSEAFLRTTAANGSTPEIIASPNTYTLSVSKEGYNTINQQVVITNGSAQTINVCIQMAPVITAAGSTLVTESCQPANGAVDPGETVSFSFCLSNSGITSTNLQATLLNTGGVSNGSGTQTYGAITSGGSPVCRLFSFSNTVSCGEPILVTLHLQDGNLDLGNVTFNLSTGTVTAPVSYSTGNIAVPITDVSTIEIPLVVNDNYRIADVNVRVRANHTYMEDLSLSLVHPDNTVTLLMNRRGGSGDNLGTGTNDCSGTYTVLDDQAASAISSGAAPFAGSFRPESVLSSLNGKQSAGTWKLRIQDHAGGDVGIVGCFELVITGLECCVYTPPPPTSSICTYGQGYYSGKKGMSCDGANTYADPKALMVAQLMNGGTITLGRAGYSVLLPATDLATATSTAGKINDYLPGGGTPMALMAGNCSITDATNPSCFKKYLTKQNKINNNLLAQTLTLALNLRMPGTGLGSFGLEEGWLATQSKSGCGELATIVSCTDDPTAIQSFPMESTVVNYLTNNGNNLATVADLFNLANDVLGRELTPGNTGANENIVPSFLAITNQVEMINNAFNKCRAVLDYFDCEKTCANITTACTPSIVQNGTGRISVAAKGSAEQLKVVAYPNPFTDRFNLIIHSPVSGIATIEFFNVNGARLATMQQKISAKSGQVVNYRGPVSSQTIMYKVSVGKYQASGFASKSGN